MTQKTNESGTNPAPAATQPNAAPAGTTITRDDVVAAVQEAVKPLAERLEKVERGGTPAPAATETGPEGTGTANLTRADLTAAMAEVVKPFADRLDALEGTTLVRSAPDATVVETKNTQADKDALAQSKKDGTIFRGAFPGLNGRRAAA